MPKISISLNEVVRDFIGQFLYTYKKYYKETEINEIDFKTINFSELFDFKNQTDLNRFMFNEAPLEIFGHADITKKGIVNKINLFIEELKDDDNIVEIVSREIGRSIPATFFFLSKTGCRVDNIRFVRESIDEWGDSDILITANPDALQNKPTGKIAIKIKTPYNEHVSGDFELLNIDELINDYDLRERVLNTKITEYEQI